LLSLALSYNLKIIYRLENIVRLITFILLSKREFQMMLINKKLNVIASIPYIGEKYAERLLKSFKTIKNIISASPQELTLKSKNSIRDIN